MKTHNPGFVWCPGLGSKSLNWSMDPSSQFVSKIIKVLRNLQLRVCYVTDEIPPKNIPESHFTC